MKQNRSHRRATPEPRKVSIRVIFTLIAVLITLALVLFAYSKKDAESIILGKLTRQPIKSRFTPVLIYYSLEGEKGALLGSGSLFVGTEGEQIITSEHLFRKELGDKICAFRTLRPLEMQVTRGITKVLHRGVELKPGERPDVVILKTGEVRLIPFYSDRTLDVPKENVRITKLNEIKKVTSLISGKQARVIAIAQSTYDAGAQYVLLEYSSISGESGTGFIDENDGLYVLKGIPGFSPEDEAFVKKTLHTSKKLSVAYGPLTFRK